MPETIRLATVAALALVAMLACTRAFLRAAGRWGLLDHPNERSAHSTVTPRGAGLPLLLAAAMGLFLTRSWWQGPPAMGLALGGLLLVTLLGLADDRFRLRADVRAAGQVVAAMMAVWASGGGLSRLPLPEPLDLPLGPLGAPLSVLWIVAVVNFYNFLDGIDGLAGLQGVVTGLAIGLAAWDPGRLAPMAGAAVAGACAGFLVFNWSPARVFLGDAGSGLLGFTFATLPLLAPAPSRGPAVFVVALSLWLFLADATFTLARRLARGARLSQPHREHVYQRLTATGLGHATVAAWLGAGAVASSAAALLAWRAGPPWPWAALALAVSLFALEVAVLVARSAPPAAEARLG